MDVSADMHKQDKRVMETKTVYQMIYLYCQKKHGRIQELCPSCHTLYLYAQKRIANCPMMETKTFCSNCKVHCYREDMREQIRNVMRFSGPRMLLHHPAMVLRHIYYQRKEKRL